MSNTLFILSLGMVFFIVAILIEHAIVFYKNDSKPAQKRAESSILEIAISWALKKWAGKASSPTNTNFREELFQKIRSGSYDYWTQTSSKKLRKGIKEFNEEESINFFKEMFDLLPKCPNSEEKSHPYWLAFAFLWKGYVKEGQKTAVQERIAELALERYQATEDNSQHNWKIFWLAFKEGLEDEKRNGISNFGKTKLVKTLFGYWESWSKNNYGEGIDKERFLCCFALCCVLLEKGYKPDGLPQSYVGPPEDTIASFEHDQYAKVYGWLHWFQDHLFQKEGVEEYSWDAIPAHEKELLQPYFAEQAGPICHLMKGFFGEPPEMQEEVAPNIPTPLFGCESPVLLMGTTGAGKTSLLVYSHQKELAELDTLSSESDDLKQRIEDWDMEQAPPPTRNTNIYGIIPKRSREVEQRNWSWLHALDCPGEAFAPYPPDKKFVLDYIQARPVSALLLIVPYHSAVQAPWLVQEKGKLSCLEMFRSVLREIKSRSKTVPVYICCYGFDARLEKKEEEWWKKQYKTVAPLALPRDKTKLQETLGLSLLACRHPFLRELMSNTHESRRQDLLSILKEMQQEAPNFPVYLTWTNPIWEQKAAKEGTLPTEMPVAKLWMHMHHNLPEKTRDKRWAYLKQEWQKNLQHSLRRLDHLESFFLYATNFLDANGGDNTRELWKELKANHKDFQILRIRRLPKKRYEGSSKHRKRKQNKHVVENLLETLLLELGVPQDLRTYRNLLEEENQKDVHIELHAYKLLSYENEHYHEDSKTLLRKPDSRNWIIYEKPDFMISSFCDVKDYPYTENGEQSTISSIYKRDKLSLESLLDKAMEEEELRKICQHLSSFTYDWFQRSAELQKPTHKAHLKYPRYHHFVGRRRLHQDKKVYRFYAPAQVWMLDQDKKEKQNSTEPKSKKDTNPKQDKHHKIARDKGIYSFLVRDPKQILIDSILCLVRLKRELEKKEQNEQNYLSELLSIRGKLESYLALRRTGLLLERFETLRYWQFPLSGMEATTVSELKKLGKRSQSQNLQKIIQKPERESQESAREILSDLVYRHITPRNTDGANAGGGNDTETISTMSEAIQTFFTNWLNTHDGAN